MNPIEGPRTNLLHEVDRTTLWLEKRPLAITGLFVVVAVWLGIDYCVTSHIGISPFSSSWLGALPALVATAVVAILVIAGIMLCPSIALRVPLGSGRSSLIDTSEINKPLGKTNGTVTSLERRWALVMVLQFILAPGLSIGIGRFFDAPDWVDIITGFVLLALEIWASLYILLFRLPRPVGDAFFAIAGCILAWQAVIAVLVSHSVVASLVSDPRDAGAAMFLYALMIVGLPLLQMHAARSFRRTALRTGFLKRSLVYSLGILLLVALFPPFGGSVLSVPMRSIGMEGRRCMVYSLTKDAAEKVHPDLLASGKLETRDISSATPTLDGIHFVKLKDLSPRRIFRLRDEFVTETHDCEMIDEPTPNRS